MPTIEITFSIFFHIFPYFPTNNKAAGVLNAPDDFKILSVNHPHASHHLFLPYPTYMVPCSLCAILLNIILPKKSKNAPYMWDMDEKDDVKRVDD